VQYPLVHVSVIHYAVSYMRDRTPIPPPLHELEAEVMEEVWTRGVSSVREVMEAINSRAPRPRAYTTYMTIMARLDSKGLLERTREGKTHFYRAAHTPAGYSDLRAQAEVDSLVDQFGELALGHFARQIAQLNPQRRRALERLARNK
jgi:predicted transcriptional regulator